MALWIFNYSTAVCSTIECSLSFCRLIKWTLNVGTIWWKGFFPNFRKPWFSNKWRTHACLRNKSNSPTHQTDQLCSRRSLRFKMCLLVALIPIEHYISGWAQLHVYLFLFCFFQFPPVSLSFITATFFSLLRMLVHFCKCPLAKMWGLQEFSIPQNVLEIVYGQTICWIGTFYCPMLPAICTIKYFCIFYIKKVAAFFVFFVWFYKLKSVKTPKWFALLIFIYTCKYSMFICKYLISHSCRWSKTAVRPPGRFERPAPISSSLVCCWSAWFSPAYPFLLALLSKYRAKWYACLRLSAILLIT